MIHNLGNGLTQINSHEYGIVKIYVILQFTSWPSKKQLIRRSITTKKGVSFVMRVMMMVELISLLGS
jgi:hypothetical protein